MKDEHMLPYNMMWNSVGILFYFGCQWLLTIFVIRFKGGYSDAGVLSLAISITNVLGTIANLNLRTFQVSDIEKQFSDGDFFVNRILMSIVSLILCISFVVYSRYGNYKGMCIIVFMIFKLSETVSDVLHGIFQKSWRLDIAGKSALLRGGAILISIGCGILLNGNLFLTILIMTILNWLVVGFYDFVRCIKGFHPDFSYSRQNVLSLIKIGSSLAAYYIFLNLINTYPRFQIERQYGEILLGIYASITAPTVLITQLASFIFNPFMGIFAECRKEQNIKRFYRLLAISVSGTILIGFVALVLSSLLGEWALVLLFGEIIRKYAYLLNPIVITAILIGFVWLLCGLLIVFKDYNVLTILTFISLCVCVITSYPLITKRNLMGAVIVLLITFILDIMLLVIRLIYLLRKDNMIGKICWRSN